MRRVFNINDEWLFSKKSSEFPKTKPKNWMKINLPHTWNSFDGVDGGNDYHRGTCYYYKALYIPFFNSSHEEIFLEFEGVNSFCKIYLNEILVGSHSGGYAKFRIKIDKKILKKSKNHLVISVSNEINDDIYPCSPKFTVYGGIYRDVNIIIVNKSHISLEHYGSDASFIDYILHEDYAIIKAKVFTKKSIGKTLSVEILNKIGRLVSYASTLIKKEEEVLELLVKRPQLWNGILNPYLYQAVFTIENKNVVVDQVVISFGLRTFEVNSKQGFILNDQKYDLRGVVKHQDIADKGLVISKEDQENDIDIILEMGANSLRLANFQHPKETYNLADSKGLIIWTEIPFSNKISKNSSCFKNIMQQLKEIIFQMYNHPSIFFLGIGNSLLVNSDNEEIIYEQLIQLQKFVSENTQNMKTIISQHRTTQISTKLNNVTDLVAYNHYFGRDDDNLKEFNAWFEKWNNFYNDKPISIGKYGTNSVVRFHSGDPKLGDFTEEYQCVYHEYVIKKVLSTNNLWSTFIGNIFDTGWDYLNIGSTPGLDTKGLVTHDRRIKKDAFYLYKAFWSFKKFIYITSRRRAIREQDEDMIIKVYSNLDEVSLRINGEFIETKTSYRIFEFNVGKLRLGIQFLEAYASGIYDLVTIEVVKDNYHHYQLK